jgi:ATP-dependent Lon protease
MVTSIVSVLTGIPVRKDVAMTGEVTLRGRVLVIGGLKEKLLAAHRGGLKTVLIPRDNERELSEIPDNVKKGLNIIPVTTVDDVLENALVSKLNPIDWDENAEEEKAALSSSQSDDDDVGGVITH